MIKSLVLIKRIKLQPCTDMLFLSYLKPVSISYIPPSTSTCGMMKLQARNYHASSIKLAGKDKKNAKSSSKNDDMDVSLPNTKDIEKNMLGRISRLEEEYRGLRGGKASVDMFNHLRVEAFGTHISLSSSAQVTLQTPTRVSISVFDAEIVSHVAEAIRSAGMNLSPSIEGNNIIVNVPKTSKETKDMLLKTAAKMADKTKQELRQIRKDAMDAVKKIKASISEDDSRKFTKDIDVITEKLVEKVTKQLKDKDNELNSL